MLGFQTIALALRIIVGAGHVIVVYKNQNNLQVKRKVKSGKARENNSTLTHAAVIGCCNFRERRGPSNEVFYRDHKNLYMTEHSLSLCSPGISMRREDSSILRVLLASSYQRILVEPLSFLPLGAPVRAGMGSFPLCSPRLDLNHAG